MELLSLGWSRTYVSFVFGPSEKNSETAEVTPQGKYSESDFKASAHTKMQGVGTVFDVPWDFDATGEDLKNFMRKATSDSDRSRVDELSGILWDVIVICSDLVGTHETSVTETSIQKDHLLRLGTRLTKVDWICSKLIDGTRVPLSSIDCKRGVARPTSQPDGLFEIQVVIEDQEVILRFCVFEVKNDQSAPKESLPQAFSEATNLALKLSSFFGKRMVCPVISGNGRLWQFGITTLVETCPFCRVLSKVLDLADDADRKTAATFLLRILE